MKSAVAGVVLASTVTAVRSGRLEKPPVPGAVAVIATVLPKPAVASRAHAKLPTVARTTWLPGEPSVPGGERNRLDVA